MFLIGCKGYKKRTTCRFFVRKTSEIQFEPPFCFSLLAGYFSLLAGFAFEPEANNCFSIFTQAFVFFETEFILISLISLSPQNV